MSRSKELYEKVISGSGPTNIKLPADLVHKLGMLAQWRNRSIAKIIDPILRPWIDAEFQIMAVETLELAKRMKHADDKTGGDLDFASMDFLDEAEAKALLAVQVAAEKVATSGKDILTMIASSQERGGPGMKGWPQDAVESMEDAASDMRGAEQSLQAIRTMRARVLSQLSRVAPATTSEATPINSEPPAVVQPEM